MVFLPNFKKRIGAKFHKIFLERFEYIRKEIPNQIVEESEKNNNSQYCLSNLDK